MLVRIANRLSRPFWQATCVQNVKIFTIVFHNRKTCKANLVNYGPQSVAYINHLQFSSFIMLCLGSLGMDCYIRNHDIRGQFYKEIVGK